MAYATKPLETTGMPPGVPYIIGNEFAERYSFYGMKCLLIVFMTDYLLDRHGNLATMTEPEAKYWYHLFVSATYFTPLLGSILADAFLGKYRTIIFVSMFYCLGHGVLAFDDTRLGLTIGLTLIAIGAGGIKPCVSAHVGDQFGASNQHLIPKVYGWFYFSINAGSAISTMLGPLLMEDMQNILKYFGILVTKEQATWLGPKVAFGVPGIMMLIATIFFWMGRHKFAHIPANGMGFLKKQLTGANLRHTLSIAVIYIFLIPFWALFDQQSSSWTLQAKKMDLMLFGYNFKAAQVQSLNPILVLALIPLFTYLIYPAINKVFTLTPLRKMAIGLFLSVVPFILMAWPEHLIGQGQQPTVLWQFFPYLFMTAAEVMVSITCLEFAYTQARPEAKSFIMSFYLLSVSAGNFFAAMVNGFIEIKTPIMKDGVQVLEDGVPQFIIDSHLPGAYYYLFFAGIMLITAIGFVFFARTYKPKTYMQDDRLAAQSDA